MVLINEKRIAMSFLRYQNQSFVFFIMSKIRNIQLNTSISYLASFLALGIIGQNYVYIVIFPFKLI